MPKTVHIVYIQREGIDRRPAYIKDIQAVYVDEGNGAERARAMGRASDLDAELQASEADDLRGKHTELDVVPPPPKPFSWWKWVLIILFLILIYFLFATQLGADILYKLGWRFWPVT